MAILTGVAVLPVPLRAQGTQGQDAVYNSSNGIVGSSAFIDASKFLGVSHEGQDLCDTIYYIFKHNYPSGGAVVDARGKSGSALTCTLGTPWYESATGYVNVPSTILLPAATIQIPATWILPSNTRLVGEGENNPLSATPGTTIQAVIGFSGSMIQFGSSPICGSNPTVCSGISVERLTLDGRVAQALQG